MGGGAGGELPFAVLQCRHLQCARTEAGPVLRRRAGHALFPVSIPYHGCALNITVQSYLDQLDSGLVACSETVPDAQRIADFLVEDFAAMRKADAQPSEPGAIGTIAVAARPAPLAAHKPIELAEAKAEPRTSKKAAR